jgi:hypothetical protein
MLRPVRGDKKDRVRASAAKMVRAHAKTLAKLAQMIAPEFLDLEEVLGLHAHQLDEFGGIAGVRDRGLLESAKARRRSLTVVVRLLSESWRRNATPSAKKRVPLAAH